MTANFNKTFHAMRPDAVVMLWLGVWWVCNLLQAGFTELAHDEAYYHMFAENLAWGYFDHPPVTALFVWLGEHLFGDTEFGVRFFFTLLQPLYLFILWRIIRPADADKRDAVLYVVLSAATLMLQLYGFIAVPDGPLMFTVSLFLLCFKQFSEEKRGAWFWMGVAMAAMAYSKYHGALVVLFTLAANPRSLLRPTLYLSGAVALLLLVPHLWWQYENDWVSFAYHLTDRNSVFKPGYVAEFVLNLLVVFNPFFVPLYVKAWIGVKPRNAVERALRLMPPAFILFFLVSTFRGYVQPQWVIAAAFGLLFVLFTYARRHPRTRRYLIWTGGITIVLIMLTRIEMIFNPLKIRFEVFDNSASYGRLAELAAGRPVVFRSSYAIAAKYRFYTGEKAYCQPNIFYRTHQWQLRDDDTQFAGGSAIIETRRDTTDTTGRIRSVVLPNGYRFNYFVDTHFHPVRRVEVRVTGIPARCRGGETLHLRLQLENPYPYAVRIDGGETSLVMLWKHGRRRIEEFDTGLQLDIPAFGRVDRQFDFVIPESLAGERFQVGFTIRKAGYTYWFNGDTQPTEVGKL